MSTVLELDTRPASAAQTVGEVWRYRHVLGMLARADFHVRYKRATFGVTWAVAVPLLQATLMAVVFSRFVKLPGDVSYAVFVLSGVLPWSYFSASLATASTALVDGSALTDKVWFPRALLPSVPPLANLVGLAVSLIALLVALPIFDTPLTWHILILLPACLLLVAFTLSLSLVLAALHVYFRDVRFLVQAGLLLWFYATPIVYTTSLVGGLKPFLEANPLTGIVSLFHLATVGETSWVVPVIVSVGCTLVLAVTAVEIYRRHDRLFVDLL